jgi:hypothetical protein
MKKVGGVALSDMFSALPLSMYILCEMPCVALRALINRKVADIAFADKGISFGLCTLLVETDLSALAQGSTRSSIAIILFNAIGLHSFLLVAQTLGVVLCVLERLESW